MLTAFWWVNLKASAWIENNNEMALKGRGLESVDWIHLA
jgi:hypothetical protein